jgi:hypothetical protein
MVDMQVLIPKVQEVARTQQIQQQQHPNQQSELAMRLHQESSRKQTSVQKSPRSEEGKIRDQEGSLGNHGETKQGQQHQEGSDPDEGQARDSRLGNTIDITI